MQYTVFRKAVRQLTAHRVDGADHFIPHRFIDMELSHTRSLTLVKVQIECASYHCLQLSDR